MKISLEWLGNFLPDPLDATRVADALTGAGLPVESIQRFGDDTVIDVEVTSNRGDCLSHMGIARELGALLERPFSPVVPQAPQTPPSATTAASVRIDAPSVLCPHYTARVIRNVQIRPSPAWMIRRLEAVGVRAINNVVDVTNYVMFEMGQPLHAFDLDKLTDRRIVVRQAKPGERLTSIDGRPRTLTPDMLVIADARRPVALAGVMGGIDTEVTAATTNVLLESARFDPLSIRTTARALAMASDSSYRFERRIDPTLPERASLRAAQLILETAGGELLTGLAEAGSSGYTPRTLDLRLPRLRKVLGIEIPSDQVVDALRRLHFAAELRGQVVAVTVPSWRLDVNVEIDLVEEVARVIGYDRVPVRNEISIRLVPPEPEQRTLDQVRAILIAGGYYESVTFSWVSDALGQDFLPPQASRLPRAEHAVRKADAQLRPSLLPGLLESVRRNESVGTIGARLFEIGATFWTDRDGTIREQQKIGLVGSSDVREVRGVIESILGRLDAGKAIQFIPDRHAGFAADACARVEWAQQVVGFVGAMDRAIAGRLSLRDVPAAAELDRDLLLAGVQPVPQLHALPRYPAVRRDLSLVVDQRVRYAQIDQVIRQGKPDLLEDLEYVTTYRGKPLASGQKSVTVALVFRSNAGTLTSDQVEAQVQQVIAAARQQLNATLRT